MTRICQYAPEAGYSPNCFYRDEEFLEDGDHFESSHISDLMLGEKHEHFIPDGGYLEISFKS